MIRLYLEPEVLSPIFDERGVTICFLFIAIAEAATRRAPASA
jgi:hypothetical protein